MSPAARTVLTRGGEGHRGTARGLRGAGSIKSQREPEPAPKGQLPTQSVRFLSRRALRLSKPVVALSGGICDFGFAFLGEAKTSALGAIGCRLGR